MFERLSASEALMELLKQPKSSQQLRDAMSCSGAETDSLLFELRDEGSIAYACGQWYKKDGGRLPAKSRAKKTDPRQLKLF